jgi:acyl carrier protein
MTASVATELEVKEFIISTLRLEDITPVDIVSDEPLFGTGLGLDSVDALEIGVALQKKYGIKLDSKSEESRAHLTSVRSLANLVERHRTGA